MAGERILIVEDDDRIGSSLLRALTGNGYIATWVTTGRHAIAETQRDAPHLVLLDLGLPDSDGLDICRQIHHENASIEIVMLTARDEELDIVIGLDAGAVDYITKPFKLAELLARIRAQLRRRDTSSLPINSVDDLRIEPGPRRVWIADVEVTLRPKEFDLLARLIASAGDAVTRETLLTDVWDEHWFGSSKTLDFHIAALRSRIDGGRQQSRITTLRGVGYRYELS